jgi:hypothetical protein
VFDSTFHLHLDSVLTFEQGDNGDAVTNVVTEFTKKIQHNQGKPITAEVHLFCIGKCENQVRQWFADWYALVQEDEDEDDDDIDENDKRRKTAALECLTAPFESRALGSLDSFLKKTKSATDTCS